MKLDQIITSSDYKYLPFWPSFSKACHVFLGMRPLMVYVDNGPSDVVIDETYGDVVRIPFYDHLPRRLQGQAGRTWYNQFMTNEATILLDVDLPVVSLDWMHEGLKQVPSNAFVGAVITTGGCAVKPTVFGGKNWLSMCYIAGAPSTFTQVFGLTDSFEDYVNRLFADTRIHDPNLLLDEPLLNYSGNITEFAHVVKPGIRSGMHDFRIDLPVRNESFWNESHFQTCIDIHGREPALVSKMVDTVIRARGL